MKRERAAADEAMRVVIAEAEQRVTHLSAAIFDSIETIGHWLDIARDARDSAHEKAKEKPVEDSAFRLALLKDSCGSKRSSWTPR